jgi:L-ascorbate metabolism protein UlaG (beta-lactamase superfamily)
MRQPVRFTLLALAALCLSRSAPVAAATPNTVTDTIRTTRGELRLTPLYHGTVMLEFDGKVIYVDPWSQVDYTNLPMADLIVVTHTHADHLDRAQVEKLAKPGTVIVSTPAGIDTLNCAPQCGRVEPVGDADRATVMGIEIAGVPMYNLVQGSRPGQPFHHKGVGAGYILSFGDTRVYFSGDTECTPEMKALTDISIAFLAMNPPRTMTTTEAAECAKAFRPRVVYPYHYRGSNTAEFADALRGVPGVEVRLRKLEGEP